MTDFLGVFLTDFRTGSSSFSLSSLTSTVFLNELELRAFDGVLPPIGSPSDRMISDEGSMVRLRLVFADGAESRAFGVSPPRDALPLPFLAIGSYIVS